MGLDMYINKKSYIGASFNHRKITGSINIKKNDEKFPIKLKRISVITEEVGYWRKAHSVHEWFVANIQNGVDDCGEYEFELEKLLPLEELLKSANIPNGSGNYDTVFVKDLGETDVIDVRETLKLIKSLRKEKGGYFTYQSSW